MLFIPDCNDEDQKCRLHSAPFLNTAKKSPLRSQRKASFGPGRIVSFRQSSRDEILVAAYTPGREGVLRDRRIHYLTIGQKIDSRPTRNSFWTPSLPFWGRRAAPAICLTLTRVREITPYNGQLATPE